MVSPAAGQVMQAPIKPNMTAPRSLFTPMTSMSPPSATNIGRTASSTARTLAKVSSRGMSETTPPAPGELPAEKGLTIRPSAGCAAAEAIASAAGRTSVRAVCSPITALQSSPSTARMKFRRRSVADIASPSRASCRFTPMAICIFHLCSSKTWRSSALRALAAASSSSTAMREASTPSSADHFARSSSILSRVHMRPPPRSLTRTRRALPERCCRATSAGTRLERLTIQGCSTSCPEYRAKSPTAGRNSFNPE
mmetsp:Transcript_24203/g.68575  ORF Transcript_24203/g.68575 Transcript_24203/m.68575 type:complete len:254 (+) Transcript_24203:362-1123(+)